jgi:hypothetical protein
MSLPWGNEPGIALLAPVTTVEQAAGAAAAGAGLVDAGRDSALVPAIRRAVGGVRVCGEHEDADLVRDGTWRRRRAAVHGPGRSGAAVQQSAAGFVCGRCDGIGGVRVADRAR